MNTDQPLPDRLRAHAASVAWQDRQAIGDDLVAAAAEIERLRRERDEYASVALVGLSGLIGTPEKGYVKDGGPTLLASDFCRLRLKFNRLADARRRLTSATKAAGLDPEPGPAARHAGDGQATEGREDR